MAVSVQIDRASMARPAPFRVPDLHQVLAAAGIDVGFGVGNSRCQRAEDLVSTINIALEPVIDRRRGFLEGCLFGRGWHEY